MTQVIKKSGRTPEQQAARDARKHAKAKASSAPAASAVDAEAAPESSAQAVRRASEQKADDTSASVKQSRVKQDGEELEIDVNAPMPMSKAEARAARKKAKQGFVVAPKPVVQKGEKKRKRLSPMSDQEDDEEEAGRAAGGAASRPKKAKSSQQNSVWIGNLPYRFTTDDLRQWFISHLKEKGEQVDEADITRVNLPKQKGKGALADNKGFAYVDFSTMEMQHKAVGLSETMLTGRRVLIKLGNDHATLPDARTPRPVKIEKDSRLPVQPHGESATLFMGNLPWDATEEALRSLIEGNADPPAAVESAEVVPAPSADAEEDNEEAAAVKPDLDAGREGKVSGLRKVRVGTFEDTGNCKGFAFLDFLTPRHATAALVKKGNRTFGGRRLVLQYASAEATKRGTSKRMTGPPKEKGARGEKAGARADRTERFGGRSNWRDRMVSTGGADELHDSAAEPAQRKVDEADIASRIIGGLDGHGESQRSRASGPAGEGKRGKKWEASGRPRPGAALAMAKREKVGIVESQGKKIVF